MESRLFGALEVAVEEHVENRLREVGDVTLVGELEALVGGGGRCPTMPSTGGANRITQVGDARAFDDARVGEE